MLVKLYESPLMLAGVVPMRNVPVLAPSPAVKFALVAYVNSLYEPGPALPSEPPLALSRMFKVTVPLEAGNVSSAPTVVRLLLPVEPSV